MNKLDQLKTQMYFLQRNGDLEEYYKVEKEYLKEVKKCKKKK